MAALALSKVSLKGRKKHRYGALAGRLHVLRELGLVAKSHGDQAARPIADRIVDGLADGSLSGSKHARYKVRSHAPSCRMPPCRDRSLRAPVRQASSAPQRTTTSPTRRRPRWASRRWRRRGSRHSNSSTNSRRRERPSPKYWDASTQQRQLELITAIETARARKQGRCRTGGRRQGRARAARRGRHGACRGREGAGRDRQDQA